MKMITLASGGFCLVIGLLVLGVNPTRTSNRVFALISIFVTGWLWTVAGAHRAMQQLSEGFTANPVPWFRANGAFASLMTGGIWFLNEVIISEQDGKTERLRRCLLLFFVITVPLLSVCFSDWYLSLDAPPPYRKAWGYYICTAWGLMWQGALIIRATKLLRTQIGIRRVEIQFLSLNLALAFVLSMAITTLGNWLQSYPLRNLSVIVFVAAFTVAAWAMTYHRIYNARQILLSLGQRMALVIAAAATLFASREFFALFLPLPADYLLGIATAGAISLWLDRASRGWLRLGNEQAVTELRRTVIGLSRTEAHAARLIGAFEEMLRTHFGATSARLIFESEENNLDELLKLLRTRPAWTALCELGWASLENLDRRRLTPEQRDLRNFLKEHGLGLVVTAPRGSPSPTLLVALSGKDSGWPFTYPEVQCLQNVAELMDNILTRSRLTAQAALQAKMDHLSMLSRGLAHDLRNLLTPVSSFLVHTEGRFPAQSVEAEVHTDAQRSMQLMNDYVREAHFFAERLAPRFEPTNLQAIFRGVGDATSKRGKERSVEIAFAIERDAPVTVDGVLVQRLLTNLVNNAVDASPDGKRVVVSGTVLADILRVRVDDAGTGIAPADLARIFEPYFTTKPPGDERRGFGLGLTIAQKIAALHGGTISVRSDVGRGGTFLVEIPVAPPR